MVDPKTLQCMGLIDLGRLGTADRYADLALMIANAEENWAAPDEAERAFAVLFNVLGINPRPRTPCLLSAIGPSDLGLMFMPPVFPAHWHVSQPVLIADTFSSLVWKVSLPDGTPAIVKGLKPIEDIADELRGADYLVWRNGRSSPVARS